MSQVVGILVFKQTCVECLPNELGFTLTFC